MSLLKKATVEQSAAKVGVLGRQGSGKTTTSALIAIGLSKAFHQGAPVAFFDTENGSDYLIPIFELEKIELLVVKSKSFKDMRQALSEAQVAGCCAFLADSYTHPWTELIESFKARSKRKRLEFHHMDELKAMWRGWTDQMLNSPLHCVLAGRLGYEWDREAPENDGEKGELIKIGTKMKGESEAGYEPSLLIELEGLQADAGRDKKTRSKKSTIVHRAYVLKDRWRTLNGRSFSFPDINTYKAGAYEMVFKAFRPHFDQLAIGKAAQRAVDVTRTSADLFDTPGEFGKRREIALEEIRESIAAIWPGQTAGEKRARQVVLEALFGTLSWSKVETKRAEELEALVPVLIELRGRTSELREASSEAGIKSEVERARDVVRERGVEDNTPVEDDVPV